MEKKTIRVIAKYSIYLIFAILGYNGVLFFINLEEMTPNIIDALITGAVSHAIIYHVLIRIFNKGE